MTLRKTTTASFGFQVSRTKSMKHYLSMLGFLLPRWIAIQGINKIKSPLFWAKCNFCMLKSQFPKSSSYSGIPFLRKGQLTPSLPCSFHLSNTFSACATPCDSRRPVRCAVTSASVRHRCDESSRGHSGAHGDGTVDGHFINGCPYIVYIEVYDIMTDYVWIFYTQWMLTNTQQKSRNQTSIDLEWSRCVRTSHETNGARAILRCYPY